MLSCWVIMFIFLVLIQCTVFHSCSCYQIVEDYICLHKTVWNLANQTLIEYYHYKKCLTLKTQYLIMGQWRPRLHEKSQHRLHKKQRSFLGMRYLAYKELEDYIKKLPDERSYNHLVLAENGPSVQMDYEWMNAQQGQAWFPSNHNNRLCSLAAAD